MFLLFTGDNFYPDAGWNGFRGAFDSIADALCHIDGMSYPGDWYQIVDLKTLTVCDEGQFSKL